MSDTRHVDRSTIAAKERGTAAGAPAIDDGRSTNLRDSPTMAHLLDALEKGTDIGHYGRLVFAMVARHFMSDEEMIPLLAKQPEQDEDTARALLRQVEGRDYNPPKRDRIMQWQAEQDFPIIPNGDDPDAGNLYRELQFPDHVYEHINAYYTEKAHSDDAR